MQDKAPEYVILLHGLSRTRMSMLPLTVPLRNRGYTPISLGYRSRSQSLEQSTCRVFEYLQAHVPPDATIHFVTHSLGGLIVRKLLTSFPPHGTPGRVVMLSPPNQGAQMAEFARKVPPLHLMLGPVLDDICAASRLRSPQNVEIGVIAGGLGNSYGLVPFYGGDNDGLVCVRETRLPEAKDTLVLPATHAFVMFNPRVWHQVFEFLQHGQFDHSGRN